MLDDVDLLVVGAGPAGCVVAERAARALGWSVLVIDRRHHAAGNCHDTTHANGVMVHAYGPHYFRAKDDAVVRYLSRFTDWTPANYEVRTLARGQLLPFPINLTTLERFFCRRLDEASARELLERLRSNIDRPDNSEEFVLARVGRELYEELYRGYTRKQWGVEPRELVPEVCGRIPVRFDRDHRYIDAPFQAMPARGFTALFEKMLDHRRIRLLLDCDFSEVRRLVRPRHATVYTGPVDAYFGHALGRLPYRSLTFDLVPVEREWVQPCVQVNYPDEGVPFTRSVEIKHVTGQTHPHTVLSFETPRAAGEPYYPVLSPGARALYSRYRALADEETARHAVYFCGRLAQYRYFNTDEVVQEALSCFRRIQQRFVPARSSSMACP